jgi:hypothetical protein
MKSRWRFGLIGMYVVLSMLGAWLAMVRRSKIVGPGLFGAGLVCFLIHWLLERREAKQEGASQREWLKRIRAIADDLSLDGYGIPNKDELASYHDAAGRAAVLSALEALPPGRRSLLEAARRIEPDAQWD